jgi:2,4-dienoyl-CoA reductase-like NADH-dependent reductase (Old Yellow Enzyme family)
MSGAVSLFSPITLRGLEIRNRLWVSPMCQWMADPAGVAQPWHVINYGQYAAGGAGLVVVESTAVSPIGRIAPGDLGLWDDAQVTALRPVADAIVQSGAVPAIQLGHAGRKASMPSTRATAPRAFAPGGEEQWQTVGPSAIANAGLPRPRELSGAEVRRIPEQFAAAAERAVAAGFRVIEIHAAHGFLLHQFVSHVSNRRTDSYGGDAVRRARLVRDVVRAVRERVGDGIVLFARVSATDWIDGGFGLDQTIQLATWLAADGVDHLDVSSGGMDDPSIPAAPGYQVRLAAALRQATGMTVNAVGQIVEPYQAAQIIVTGQADAVMVGRAWMRNPHLAAAWASALGVNDLRGIVAPPYLAARWGS